MKKYDLDEKDTVLRLQLPSSMKNDLQKFAERKGLNLSQFMRQYIEKVLDDEETQASLSSDERNENKDSQDKNDEMQATLSVRCQQELKDMYGLCCMQNSLKGSEILRKYMRDFVEFRYKLYTFDGFRPLDTYLDYILMFLKITEYTNQGNGYIGYTVRIKQDIPKDAPSIERVDAYTYRINDIYEHKYYLVHFLSLGKMDIQPTPFK